MESRLSGLAVAHLIETDGPGGAERMVASLAHELQAAGCSSVAFLPADGEAWLGRELAAGGVPVEYFRFDHPFAPALARSLARAFHRYHVDVVHSHEFAMAVYGAWAARRAGMGHVFTMHGSRYYAQRLRRRVALRLAAAASAAVVAVSHELADRLSRDLWLPRSRIAVIPNGVPRHAPAHGTLRAELGLAAEDRLLLAVGNLYPVKGHRVLVEALARLAPRHGRVHAAIAGRGAEEPRLREAARVLGVAERLHLLGLRSDVGNLLASADVFVLPSLSEGLPLALLEAMFAGRPIVATDVGEVRRALADGAAGCLVPPADPAALADAIERLLERPDAARSLGARAARHAAAAYGLDRCVSRYAALYAHAARGGRRAPLTVRTA